MRLVVVLESTFYSLRKTPVYKRFLFILFFLLFASPAFAQFSTIEVQILKSLSDRSCASNEVPVWNSTTLRWDCGAGGGGGSGTPGGSNTQVQFNDGGAFGGAVSFTFNKVTGELTVTGGVIANLTGNVVGNLTGNVTGNASTATAFDHTPTLCNAGEAPTGVNAGGNAVGCASITGGAGPPVVLDLGDNGANESAGLAEIATTGDTNGIFSEPSADKLLIDVGQNWPTADVAVLANAATALAANGANCSAGQFPLGVDASGAVENCTALPTTIAGTANQITASAATGAITLSIPNSPTLPGTTTGTFSGNLTGNVTGNVSGSSGSTTGNAATATALAANGANCSAGSFPLGVDASGAAESCTDAATQTELNTHAALTGTSAHGATTTNTASQIVSRDASGNFAAGTITASLTGNVTGNLTGTVTGNASTATALAADPTNCSAGNAPLGVDAGGVAQNCFDVATQTELDAHAALSGTSAHSATSTNTASRIVSRDASGNFAAGTITANLTGNVTGNVTGNASTADALNSDPTDCDDGQAPTGIGADGAAANCTVYLQSESDTPDAVYARNRNLTILNSKENAERVGDGVTQTCRWTDSISGPRYEPCDDADIAERIMPSKSRGLYSTTDDEWVEKVTPSAATPKAVWSYVLASTRPKKSIWFPAGSLSTDGTQCAAPAEVTINSGAKRFTIICADNDSSTIYGEVVMPDSWDMGTVTIEGSFVQTAADTSAINSDVAFACRSGAGGTINNTWGTEVAMDITNVSGSNALDHRTTAEATPNGTCTEGALLQFRWQLDATGTTTAVSTLHILGFKVEYGITSRSD